MDGWIRIKTELDTKSFEAQLNQLQNDLADYEQQYETYINAGRELTFEEQQDFEKLQTKIEKTKNKIVDLTKRQQELRQSSNFEGVSSSIGGVIRNVARWGLALFGIRSAYMGIRSAIGILSQGNKKLADDIQYIKWSIAKVLEPIITRIVSWVYKVIQGINYLIYRITGVNLLAKATAKNFKSASGSVKEMQKSLQGFDEASILNKPSGAGGGGMTLPSEDLSKFNLLSNDLMNTLDKIAEVLRPIWENYLKPIGKWIIEKPSNLLKVLGAIIGLKLATKIAKIIGTLGGATGAGATGLLGMLGVLGLLVADVWLISIAVKDYEKVQGELQTLKGELSGIEENTKNSTDAWKENREELYKQAKESKDSAKKLEILADALFSTVENNEAMVDSLDDSVTWLSYLDGTAHTAHKSIKNLNEGIDENIKFLTEMAKKGELNDNQLKKLQNRYIQQIEQLKKNRDNVKKNSFAYETYTKQIDSLQKELDSISKKDYEVDVETKTDKKELTDLEKKIDDITTTSHTISIKASTKEANKSVKSWLKTLGSTLFGVLFPSLKFDDTIAKFHRMGGIVNLPGKGVPVAHYGGESGPEGIIPMSEEAQMDLLGQSIARHVVINLTNVTKLNARQIAKETRKITADDDFATNGGV